MAGVFGSEIHLAIRINVGGLCGYSPDLCSLGVAVIAAYGAVARRPERVPSNLIRFMPAEESDE